MKFIIENLSYEQADSFLISLENDKGDSCTVLVDGNDGGKDSPGFQLVKEAIKKVPKLDYIIITHIDSDHLKGILNLYQCKENDKGDGDIIGSKLEGTKVIYNYVTKGEISYSQAEKLEALVDGGKLLHSCRKDYDNTKCMLKLMTLEKRNIIKFTEEKKKTNAYLTFLSPDMAGINEVIKDYETWKAEKDEKKKKTNRTLVNKHSVVFLLEFCDKTVLFTGDSYWDDVEKQLKKVKNLKRIDLLKIPHHGANKNTIGLAEWAKENSCNTFCVTGKQQWDEKHLDKELLNDLKKNVGTGLCVYTKIHLKDEVCWKNIDSIDMLAEEME